MITTALTCALVFTLGGSEAVTPLSTRPVFKQVEQSKNVSQLLRSNAGHYWATVRDAAKLKELAEYVHEQGVINGDPHLGNFSVIPVSGINSKPGLKFLNIDFDDGGRGPFALEFVRYVAVAKASSNDIKVKDLFDAYLRGLRGDKMEEPLSIRSAVNLSMDSYDSQRIAYVQKRVQGSSFKLKAGEIEKWEGRPYKEDIAAVLSGYKVLDVAKRPVERGGSMDSLRLWVLVTDKSGNQRILELKEYQETALSEYSSQSGMKERVAELFDVYWEKIDNASYTVEKILDRTYWVREKKVEVLAYKSKIEEDEARVYIANLIGSVQGRQAEGPKYLAKIEADPERFKDAVKTVVKDYLTAAAEVME